LASLASIALTTFTGLFVAFSSIVLSFFFLVNDDQIAEGFAQIFPQRRRATARKVATEVSQSFGSYVAGQIVVSGITAVVVAGLSALIGFRFSLILGIITFIGYSVPVIGMLVAEVIAVALCLPQGLWMVLWIQVIMFGMARVSDNVLVPKIMGESVGVSPIVVMLAVFAGGELFGLPGLLLGIPAAALIKILWKYFVSPWMRLQLDGPDANATTVTTATATATTTTTTAN
jgi:predicted PurR-regulated permease PerM